MINNFVTAAGDLIDDQSVLTIFKTPELVTWDEFFLFINELNKVFNNSEKLEQLKQNWQEDSWGNFTQAEIWFKHFSALTKIEVLNISSDYQVVFADYPKLAASSSQQSTIPHPLQNELQQGPVAGGSPTAPNLDAQLAIPTTEEYINRQTLADLTTEHTRNVFLYTILNNTDNNKITNIGFLLNKVLPKIKAEYQAIVLHDINNERSIKQEISGDELGKILILNALEAQTINMITQNDNTQNNLLLFTSTQLKNILPRLSLTTLTTKDARNGFVSAIVDDDNCDQITNVDFLLNSVLPKIEAEYKKTATTLNSNGRSILKHVIGEQEINQIAALKNLVLDIAKVVVEFGSPNQANALKTQFVKAPQNSVPTLLDFQKNGDRGFRIFDGKRVNDTRTRNEFEKITNPTVFNKFMAAIHGPKI